jgi:hypothetical protein
MITMLNELHVKTVGKHGFAIVFFFAPFGKERRKSWVRLLGQKRTSATERGHGKACTTDYARVQWRKPVLYNSNMERGLY